MYSPQNISSTNASGITWPQFTCKMNLDCKIRVYHVILVYENNSLNISEIGLVSWKQEANKIDFAISNKQ